MKLIEAHSTELDRWIAEHHYLKSTPACAVLRLEFVNEDNGERIGAMMWGRPTAPKSDQTNLLQLTRMYFIDDTPHCTESHALSMARKYIRKHHPQIKGLITFASTGHEHEGIIYKADGWFEVSRSKSPQGSWENRQGRTDRDLSIKIKYCRTP